MAKTMIDNSGQKPLPFLCYSSSANPIFTRVVPLVPLLIARYWVSPPKILLNDVLQWCHTAAQKGDFT